MPPRLTPTALSFLSAIICVCVTAPAAGALSIKTIEGTGNAEVVAAPLEAHDLRVTSYAGGIEVRGNLRPESLELGHGCYPYQALTSSVLCATDEFLVGSVFVSLGDRGDKLTVVNNGNHAMFLIDGGDGRDRIDADQVPLCVIDGGDGHDQIDACGLEGVIYGQGGNDFIRVGDGSSCVRKFTLFGGEGNDRILGNRSTDTVFGGPGNDSIEHGPCADDIYGEEGSDKIRFTNDGQADQIDCGTNTGGSKEKDRAWIDDFSVAPDTTVNCELNISAAT